MGCWCNRDVNLDQQLSFDTKKPDKVNNLNSYSSYREMIKDSFNNFISEFNKNKEKIGDYISKEEFYSIIPTEIQNYMKDNPLNRNQENIKKSTYEMEPFEFKNGNIYQGKWNKNLAFEGPGEYYLKQDKVFVEGNWDNGNLKNGRIFLPNGDIYEGEIKDSNYNGKGKLKTIKNEIYEGDFVNGEKTGNGKIIFEDGTIYEGNLEKGQFKGKGKMIWKNGYEYIGEFNGPILSGKGKLKGPEGDIYEGDFENNLFHGKGKYTFNKNGNEYEGDFQYGIKKGKGKFTCVNQYIYDGSWDNDLPCGIGKLTNWEKNGILKCIYRFGKIAEEPIYELGNEDDFNSIDLNIKADEMTLNTKGLPHLDFVESESTQYKLKTSLSFLD